MSNLKRARGLLMGVLGAAVCLIGVASAQAVCTRIVVYGPQPAPYAGCVCQGVCCCTPMSPWGYTQRQWRPWPGAQYRQDIVFPQSRGIERLAAPRGERPKPLPREVYVKPKTKAERDAEEAGRIQVREGAPVDQLDIPQPFGYNLEPDQSMPGLDFQEPEATPE